MTPEQVSALSDDELNRAMLWLYCQCSVMRDNGRYIEIVHVLKNGDGFQCAVNYLTNYNITISLMKCLNMRLDFIQHDGISSCHAASYDYGFIVKNTNTLRAACECLVLIALESKKW